MNFASGCRGWSRGVILTWGWSSAVLPKTGAAAASPHWPPRLSHAGSIERDYETKRAEYLAYGLLEYWIVDPLKEQVTVLTRRGDSWDEAVFRGEQVIRSLVLPGFATTVAELWIDVEADDDDTTEPGGNGS